jgi:hypothetical protein
MKKSKRLEDLQHDAAILAQIRELLREQVEFEQRVKDDERAIIAKAQTGDAEGAMELLQGVLRSYSPNLTARWADEE